MDSHALCNGHLVSIIRFRASETEEEYKSLRHFCNIVYNEPLGQNSRVDTVPHDLQTIGRKLLPILAFDGQSPGRSSRRDALGAED
jgi:hypothetical protein